LAEGSNASGLLVMLSSIHQRIERATPLSNSRAGI